MAAAAGAAFDVKTCSRSRARFAFEIRHSFYIKYEYKLYLHSPQSLLQWSSTRVHTNIDIKRNTINNMYNYLISSRSCDSVTDRSDPWDPHFNGFFRAIFLYTKYVLVFSDTTLQVAKLNTTVHLGTGWDVATGEKVALLCWNDDLWCW